LVEQVFKLSRSDEKLVEKVLFDETFITCIWCSIKAKGFLNTLPMPLFI
jgi:hypothetical protein